MAVQWSVPVWMWPLLLVVAAGAVVWTVVAYRRSRPAVGSGLRIALTMLRSASFILLIAAMAGPVVSRLRPVTAPAELVFLLEDSGSMDLTDAEPGLAASSRWQRALAAVARLDSAFADHQPPVRRVLLRGNGLGPLQEIRLNDAQAFPPINHGTSLDDLLRRAQEMIIGQGARALVLFSDGQETGTGTASTGVPQAGSAVPVFVAGVGAASGTVDRSIKDLRYPSVVYAGDEVVVDLAVDQRALPAGSTEPLIVTLRDQQGIVAADTVVSDERVVPVQLTFRPRGEGLQALRLDVSPVVAERFRENNRATLAVDVRRSRSRILVVAGVPGWDVRFLLRAAAEEQRLELSVVYPSDRGLVFADSLVRWEAPTTSDGWQRWDAVVLTGWESSGAPLDWAPLAAAVQNGMGLLVLPSAAGSAMGAPIAKAPPAGLAELLPVDTASWRWERRTAFASVAADGVGHPIVNGIGLSGGSWDHGSSPPWREVAVVGVRAGATVVLEANGSSADGTALPRPVLVVAKRGSGRVAWFGARHLWEWTFWDAPASAGRVAVERNERRLLRDLLVWLAGGAESAGLDFAPNPGLCQEGERIRLGARWRDMRGAAVTGRPLSVVLRPAGDRADTLGARTFALRESVFEAGLSEVELPPLEPGRYTVQLIGGGEPAVEGRIEDLIVTDTSVERSQVRLDQRRLEQLAARSDGFYVAIDEPGGVAALAARLEAVEWSGSSQTQRVRYDIWTGWPFLAVMISLLAVEWFLRRRHGLL